MRRLTRRSLLAGTAGAAGVAMLGRRAFADAKFTIRFSILPNETAPEYKGYLTFKEIVERETGGDVIVKLYPNSQLGNEREATEQVKIGALEMTSGGGDIQGYVPQVGLFYLPFLFPTDQCFVSTWDIQNSPIAQTVASLILDKTKSIRALSFLPAGGTRNLILRSRPVHTIGDFKGVKIRVNSAPTSFATMNALGAAPVVMAFPDVYNALQTGVIDAAENLLTTFVSMKWSEVCKYITMSNHNHVLHVAMINEPFFQSLPKNYQDVVTNAAQAMAKDWHDPVVAAMEETRKQLAASGIQINELEDVPAWMAATAPLQDEWAKKNNFEAELALVRKMCA